MTRNEHDGDGWQDGAAKFSRQGGAKAARKIKRNGSVEAQRQRGGCSLALDAAEFCSHEQLVFGQIMSSIITDSHAGKHLLL